MLKREAYRLMLKLKRHATQAHIEVEMRRYSGSRVGFKDAKLLRPTFELEHETTQACILMINAAVVFSVERNLHVSYLMKSAFELKHHYCVLLKIRF